MNLKVMRLLADNGTPLRITLEAGQAGSTISRDGSPPMEYERWSPRENLEKRLRHYPREVTINGEALERTTGPTLARVEVLDPTGPNLESRIGQPIDMGQEELPLGFNALVGGIIAQIFPTVRERHWTDLARRTHFSLKEGETRNYRLLKTVRLSPHYVLESQDIGGLREDGYGITMSQELTDRADERRARLREMTLQDPRVPPAYGGRAYAYALVGPGGNGTTNQPVPMAVMGTPVLMEPRDEMTNPEFVSAIAAIMESDGPFVPVHDAAVRFSQFEIPRPEDDLRSIRNITFRITPDGAENAQSIMVEAGIDGEDQPLRAPARFLLQGSNRFDAQAHIVPGTIGERELYEKILLAYAEDDSDTGYDEIEQDTLERKAANMALHLTGGSNLALRNEIRTFAETFSTMVPLMNTEPISMTRGDGRITVTVNPVRDAEKEAAQAA